MILLQVVRFSGVSENQAKKAFYMVSNHFDDVKLRVTRHEKEWRTI